MRSSISFFLLLLLVTPAVEGQSPYKLSQKTDYPLVAGGLILTGTGFIVGRQQSPLSEITIEGLDKQDIWSFDRGATGNFSQKSGTASDVFRALSWAGIVGAVASNKQIRSDYKVIGVMVAETYLVNTGVTNWVKIAAGRVRPFVYNEKVEITRKMTRSAKKSFFSGHTSTTASFSFLLAKIVNDYSKNRLVKSLVWTSAITLPGLVGYLRVKAGKHFPTDVISGYVVGGLIGYLIPQLHKMKPGKNNLSLQFGLSNSTHQMCLTLTL